VIVYFDNRKKEILAMMKQNPEDMLPSQMASYIKALHEEIDRLEEINKELQTPDLYITENSSHTKEADLLRDLDVGDVVEAVCARTIESSFLVKLSKKRIDRCSSRIEAEGKAMLHSV
jgi:ribosomal protein S1